MTLLGIQTGRSNLAIAQGRSPLGVRMAGRPPYVGYFYNTKQPGDQQPGDLYGLIKLRSVETGTLARQIDLTDIQQKIAISMAGTPVGTFTGGGITFGNRVNLYVTFSMSVDVQGVTQTLGILADIAINGNLNWWVPINVDTSGGVVTGISSVPPVLLGNGDIHYDGKIYSSNGSQRAITNTTLMSDVGGDEVYNLDDTSSVKVSSVANYPPTYITAITVIHGNSNFSSLFKAPFFPNVTKKIITLAYNESMTSTSSNYFYTRVGYVTIDLVTRASNFQPVYFSLSLSHITKPIGGAYPLGNGAVFIYTKSSSSGSKRFVYVDETGFVDQTSIYLGNVGSYFIRDNSLFLISFLYGGWIIKRIDLVFDEVERKIKTTPIWSVTSAAYTIGRITAG